MSEYSDDAKIGDKRHGERLCYPELDAMEGTNQLIKTIYRQMDALNLCHFCTLQPLLSMMVANYAVNTYGDKSGQAMIVAAMCQAIADGAMQGMEHGEPTKYKDVIKQN